jgi:hypothetical protein
MIYEVLAIFLQGETKLMIFAGSISVKVRVKIEELDAFKLSTHRITISSHRKYTTRAPISESNIRANKAPSFFI